MAVCYYPYIPQLAAGTLEVLYTSCWPTFSTASRILGWLVFIYVLHDFFGGDTCTCSSLAPRPIGYRTYLQTQLTGLSPGRSHSCALNPLHGRSCPCTKSRKMYTIAQSYFMQYSYIPCNVKTNHKEKKTVKIMATACEAFVIVALALQPGHMHPSMCGEITMKHAWLDSNGEDMKNISRQE